MTTPPASYLHPVPGLDAAVAACRPARAHAALIARLRQAPALATTRLAAVRGDRWLAARQVYRRDGTLVAPDHVAWLTAQVAQDGGRARTTYARLKDAGYRLTQCNITNLYLVADAPGGDPSQFLQVEVVLEHEVLDRELLDPWPWRTPGDVDDLIAADGPPLPEAERVGVRPPAYRLRRIIDVEAWLAVADAMEQVRREAFRQRTYRVTDSTRPGITAIQSADEVFPGWDRRPPNHRRFFHDWQRSSAAAAPLCDHWSLDLTDYTDPQGMRWLTLTPMWAFPRPLAKVKAGKGSDYEFYGALQRLDRRVGVPFAWYFFMLHCNRVDGDAGERVIRAAEDGTIVLPERDYRVLKDWQQDPYGF